MSKEDLAEKIFFFPKKLKAITLARLREKAFLRTRARLIENGVNIDSLKDEELEVIIRDEEDRLISEYKSRGIIALLALLGVSWF